MKSIYLHGVHTQESVNLKKVPYLNPWIYSTHIHTKKRYVPKIQISRIRINKLWTLYIQKFDLWVFPILPICWYVLVPIYLCLPIMSICWNVGSTNHWTWSILNIKWMFDSQNPHKFRKLQLSMIVYHSTFTILT